MPSFTREELEQSVGMNETVAIWSHSKKQGVAMPSMGERKYRPLSETKTLIKSGIRQAGRPLTYRECAIVLERRPTPHLRGILDNMVASGELKQTEDKADNGYPRFWYDLP